MTLKDNNTFFLFFKASCTFSFEGNQMGPMGGAPTQPGPIGGPPSSITMSAMMPPPPPPPPQGLPDYSNGGYCYLIYIAILTFLALFQWHI